MKRMPSLLLAFLLVAGVAARVLAQQSSADAIADGPLHTYVAQEDDSYGWVKRQETTLAGATLVELTLTSQTWRDIVWKHQLFILKPTKVTHPRQALLMIAGGSWKPELEQPPEKPGQDVPGEIAILAAVVNRLGSPVVILNHVPHQPMFDGMVEDDLISYTFEKFLETGEGDWPLLLPMTKSAVRAMDAVQEFAREQWDMGIENFTVTGGSKRGWTTWLTGAVDPRVNAIAPIVIDVLNMPVQMKHQLAAWGEYSEQIQDYTRRGIQQQSDTPRGRQLNSIVDPYSYLSVLTQPKLLIIATNDRYWPLDALRIYWNDLVGEKRVLYVPNNGHGVSDLRRIVGGVTALHRQADGQLELPEMSWDLLETDGRLTLKLKSDPAPKSVSAWIATSPTRDFREAKWKSYPAELAEESYRYELEIPAEGYAAMFGEAAFEAEGVPYFLSTNVKIVESAAVAMGGGGGAN